MLPKEILDNILSHLPVKDWAELYHVDKQWNTAVLQRLKPIINDRLQVAVFDDSEETHSVGLPFAGIDKGLAIYKEPANVLDAPKEMLYKVADMQFRWCFAHRPEIMDFVLRWIHCSGDLRSKFIYLDLDRYNFGRLKLGENMNRKVGKNMRNTYEDTTYVAYTVHYKDEWKNDIGMSWFRIHEIRLPLARLELGKSNMFL